MDSLDTILDSVRLETSILSRAHLRAPWAIDSGNHPCAIFHGIVSGQCHIQVPGAGPAVALGPGHIVLIPCGEVHVLCDQPGRPPSPRDELAPAPGSGRRVVTLENRGTGEVTRIVCGTVTLDHEAASWLFELLPVLIHARPPAGDATTWVEAILQRLDGELERDAPGGEAAIKRFTEILVFHTLRTFATAPVDDEPDRGWLAAVRDPRIGKALALIHNEPEKGWSVPELASEIGMSRSRFFQRFSDLVGIPPARYMSRWRVTTAATLMREPNLSTEEIAGRVGYASVDSFRTAFRRHIGQTVPAYRRAMRRSA